MTAKITRINLRARQMAALSTTFETSLLKRVENFSFRGCRP
ncbi:hypothetical protein [Streptomyces sp. CA2R101]